MELARIDRENLTGRVTAELRAALLEGRFRPGQRLKIREVAASMGVSETPVREAVMQLIRDGGLTMRPGGAITVVRLDLAAYFELRKIRQELEPLAAAEAMPHQGPAQIAALAKIHAELLAAEKARDWRGAIILNWRFHRGLYAPAGMPALMQIIENLHLRIGPLMNFVYPHALPSYEGTHQHLNALDALRRRDARALRQAVRQDMIEGGRALVRLLTEIEAGRIVPLEHANATPARRPSRKGARK